MRPLDPRLLRYAEATRRHIAVTALLGTLAAAAVIGQAIVLAGVIASVFGGGRLLPGTLAMLGLLVLARAGLAWAQERFGRRSASTVIAQLRGAVLAHLAATRPFETSDRDDAAAVTTVLTSGLQGLEGYLTRYLPQLLMVVTVTPGVVAVIWWNDLMAGLAVLFTLPLVPLFMALVGLSTQAQADRRLRSLQRLGAQVLDLIAGLPTLRAFGRESGQADRVRAAGHAHRRATMRTLVTAFLSALVLETVTTLSVALVAVGVGLRLVGGDLDLHTALVVLILAPEAYLPLRMVGTHHHASVDGLAACEQAFGILETPLPRRGSRPAPSLTEATIVADDVYVLQPGSGRAAPAGVSAVLRPGQVTALTGPSGSGKSTVLAVLLGLRRLSSGAVLIHGGADRVDLADVDPDGWWQQVSWVPQQPALVPGTVLENLMLEASGPIPDRISQAAALTGLDQVVAGLPDGWQTRLGQGGMGLSAGQRQRLALARALLRPARLVLLDEPTGHLDAQAESVLADTIAALRQDGRIVVLATHRQALIELADQVITVRSHDHRTAHLVADPAAEAVTEAAAEAVPA